MSTPRESVPLSPAAEIFAEFLTRRSAGDDANIDALRAAHPEHADELSRLHANWLLLSDAFDNERDARAAHVSLSSPGTDLLAPLRREAPGSERLTVRGEYAHGGRGQILEAWDAGLQRELAMKVVLDADGGSDPARVDPRSLASFIDEARVTGQLGHPGIVPVHEIGIDAAGRVFFTMPLIRGENLHEAFKRVADGEWPQARALNVLLRVCEAVAYAHSRSVIHRDLKPSNVMVGPFGETYVIDWGLARASVGTEPGEHDATQSPARAASPSTAQLTTAGDVVGTPAYMAPEQAQGDHPSVGPHSDVYAVGAMLYELLAGRAPFGGPKSTPDEVVAAVKEGAPSPLATVASNAPAELVAICERAMARDKAQRYASMTEMAEDLRAFLELRVVKAYETGAVAEFKKWVRRNTWFAAALLALVLTLIAGLAATSWLNFVATSRGEDVLRLSAKRDVERLRTEAELLWPAHPELIDDYSDWIDRARALHADLPLHRDKLASLRASAGVDAEAPAYSDAASRTAWWDEQLSLLIADLSDLESGLLGAGLAGESGWSVPTRLEFANELTRLSVESEVAVERWEAATVSARGLYSGLELTPRMGLLPIGSDPTSGHLEFWLIASGEEPNRDEDGELLVTPETGIVLVLLPGGSFTMGAQSEEPDAPGYDSFATPNEGPPHEVQLDPFLLSKFETTQAQWVRLMSVNPSFHEAGSEGMRSDYTDLHPVDFVTWESAQRFAQRLGCRLPTEAQWEYACRAGSTTRFERGDEPISMQGFANLADEGSAPYWNATWSWMAGLDDGYESTAPIGSFKANAFALHDMHGNVHEWCRCAPSRYDKYEPATGHGARRAAVDRETAIYRGGSYASVEGSGRVSWRGFAPIDAGGDDSGFRLSIDLDQ